MQTELSESEAMGLLPTELKMLYGKVCGLHCLGVLMGMFMIVYLLLWWSGDRFLPESNQGNAAEQETYAHGRSQVLSALNG